jgi:TonB family protein
VAPSIWIKLKMRLRAAFVAIAVVAMGGAARAQAPAEPPPQEPDQGAIPGGGAGAARVPAKPEQPNEPVTPPKILHFESAPYPKEAQEQGLEANVVLRLDIDKEGKVTAVQVVEPAGHGFDEAASEAAQKFLFEPARRGTTPIPVRIPYRYSFTLTPAATQEPAPPAQSLRGTVRAADGDVPIAGATLEIAAAEGEPTTVTTDEQGAWSVSTLPPGHYRITVKAPGYEPVHAEEDVVAGTVAELVYRLVPQTSGIEVVVRGQRPPREVTRRTLEQREISRIPGTGGDALKSLQSLPGVGKPPGLAGLLIVRGSAPNDTQVFIDGIAVPIVYHFGGLSSVVPTEMLDRIDFYPGNFSAQYGRVMGGIVDVAIRSPKGDGKYHGLAQLDLIDARVLAEGPVPGLSNVNFLVAGRRSWVDVWLKPVLTATGAGVTVAPVYYDYQAYVEAKLAEKSTLRLGVFGSDDRLALLIRDPAAQDPAFGGDISVHTGFYRLEARYQADLTSDLRLNIVGSYGLNLADFAVGTLFFRLETHPFLNRTEISYHPLGWLSVHAGADLLYAPFHVQVRAPPPPRPGEPDPGPFAARAPQTLDDQDHAWRPGVYAEAEVTPDPSFKIVPGLRADYARDTGHYDVSPRVSARYDIVHDFPRTTVKGGVGLFYQPPQFQETRTIFGTPGLLSNRAIHYSIGIEQDITRPIELSVEGFYKYLNRIVARTANNNGGFDYNNLGTGSVVGAEVLLKYKPDDRFFGWLAYTLSRSVRNLPPDYQTQLFQYDQTHILTVLGSYRLGRGWEFGARFRLVSGSLYTPILAGVYDADAGAYAPIDGAQFSQRMPTFHQLDLRVDKSWRYAHWTLRAYLDVQNAYNRANPEGLTSNYNFSQSRVQAFLPIIPSIGVRGEF